MVITQSRTPSDSPLFSTSPVVKTSQPPVIVVGLPRSGSSFLAHVLSTLEDWYVYDDLYIYQRVQGLNIKGKLTPQQLEQLVNDLAWSVRGRIKNQKNFLKPKCTFEDVDKMKASVIETFSNCDVYWYELLEEWMMRLALHHGCNRWGYKTPQDFMHMDELLKLFPGTRFIFIMRDPRNMMASKKYVNTQDGHPHDYHPLAYALYWNMACEKAKEFAAKQVAPLMIVQFEKLIANPDEVASNIANFLETSLSEPITNQGSNSSFNSKKRNTITSTESWLCETITRSYMKEFGYDLKGAKPKIQDIPDLLMTSFNFTVYKTKRIITRADKRSSVVAYLKTLIGRKKSQ